LILLMLSTAASAQVQLPAEEQAPPPAEEAAAETQPAEAAEATEAEAAGPETPEPQAPPPAPTGALNLQNASLVQVVDALCRQLRINYVLDPRVEGSVTLNTYGEPSAIDTRELLDMILRINGAAMVPVGDMYRIVPLTDAARIPTPPETNAVDFPEDGQIMLNLVFLKYVTVGELSSLLEPFLGEGASSWAYSPANLLLILDSRRNMRRLMDLVALFDNDTLASQRVRLFEVENSRPSDIVQELETILQSISLGESGSPIRFLPVDRLNLVISVAPNPGAFEEVEKWLRRLDQPVEETVGTVSNYVYRVKYGRADAIAAAIMSLYTGYTGYSTGYGLFSGAAAGLGNRYRGTGIGSGVSGAFRSQFPSQSGTAEQLTGSGLTSAEDQTGTFLGTASSARGWAPGVPRVVPNPMDNSLLIQASPQEYRQILRLLDQLDVPPRQVLIDAKIYEVQLTGALSAGVQAYLDNSGEGASSSFLRSITAGTGTGGLGLTAEAVVDRSRQLLLWLEIDAQENTTRTQVLSAPSIIATDSVPASITVGAEVPTLTGQAVSPIQSEGNSLFTNTIANRDSGVTLGILATVNPSGIVTMVIDQEVSTPQPPPLEGIQSPSFSKKAVQTQVTVADGDTIAIGGIINESHTESSGGVPFLHRIPVLGYAFGGKSMDRERTELVVFLTPRVIYDTNQIIDATEELKSRFRRLNRLIEEE